MTPDVSADATQAARETSTLLQRSAHLSAKARDFRSAAPETGHPRTRFRMEFKAAVLDLQARYAMQATGFGGASDG